MPAGVDSGFRKNLNTVFDAISKSTTSRMVNATFKADPDYEGKLYVKQATKAASNAVAAKKASGSGAIKKASDSVKNMYNNVEKKVGNLMQASSTSGTYYSGTGGSTSSSARKTSSRSSSKGRGSGVPSSSKKQAAGFNKSVAKPYMKKLGAVLDDLRKDIKKLGDDIQLIEKGDGKTAYWSGKKAKMRVVRLKEHYNNHVKVYNSYLHVYNILHAKYVTGATNNL